MAPIRPSSDDGRGLPTTLKFTYWVRFAPLGGNYDALRNEIFPLMGGVFPSRLGLSPYAQLNIGS